MFLGTPVVLDTDHALLPGNFLNKPIPQKISLPKGEEVLWTEKQREEMEKQRAIDTYLNVDPPYIDVSDIPECEPNIRLKK